MRRRLVSCMAIFGSAMHCLPTTGRCWQSSTGSSARWAIPLSDVSYLLRWWSTPDVRTVQTGTPSSTAGFPSAEDLAKRYEARSGRSLDQLDYWMAFAAWRAAAMLAGVYRRYVDGKMGAPPENLSLFPLEVERRVEQAMAFAGLA